MFLARMGVVKTNDVPSASSAPAEGETQVTSWRLEDSVTLLPFEHVCLYS